MLDQEKITIWKLKKAFKLNDNDVNKLLDALLPDGEFPNKVYPFGLWRKAYNKFWEQEITFESWHLKENTPKFPTNEFLYVHSLPADYYYDQLINFFRQSSKVIRRQSLQWGIDYVIVDTYDDEFPYEKKKDSLFKFLDSDPNEIPEWQANNPYDCIRSMFIDTILVDKACALKYLVKTSCPLEQEVKGITKELYAGIVYSAEVKDATAVEDEKSTIPRIIQLPATIRSNSIEAIVKYMKNVGLDDSAIVFTIFTVFNDAEKKVNKTELGRLLKNNVCDHRCRGYVNGYINSFNKYNFKIEFI